MRILPVKEHQTYFPVALEMLCDFLLEKSVVLGEKKSRDELYKTTERMLHERLCDSGREIFLFEKGRAIVGFSEVILEEECFPDEDLPETCMKILSFYIVPQARRQKLGSAFLKLIRTWGRDKKAALLEIEIPGQAIPLNQFFLKQGLELVGAGVNNCYRSFI